MEDNDDPKHTSKICKKFKEENNIENVSDWLPSIVMRYESNWKFMAHARDQNSSKAPIKPRIVTSLCFRRVGKNGWGETLFRNTCLHPQWNKGVKRW